MVRLLDSWRFSLSSAPTVGNPFRPLQPETVSDIVYVPLETPILAAARERGLRTVGGLGMLLHQAVPGFAHWFGVTPQVTPELHALVEADVQERHRSRVDGAYDLGKR